MLVWKQNKLDLFQRVSIFRFQEINTILIGFNLFWWFGWSVRLYSNLEAVSNDLT